MQLTAYPLTPDAPEIVPAERKRKWMQTNANPDRCLPMSIANQSGWWVLNPAPFTAFCDIDTGVVTIHYFGEPPLFPAKHHFGAGVMTYDLPFLWRTEPGWDLLVRGPANIPIPGAHALEGVLEAGWADIPVPINWQLDPGILVSFPKNYPIAQVVPVQTRRLEEFEPAILLSDEALAKAKLYYESREDDFITTTPTKSLTGYFKGERPDGEKFDVLQRLDLKEFRVDEI